MSLWWCKHKNRSGKTMTILHDGDQCTSTNEEAKCTLYQKGWTFISCKAATMVIELDEKESLVMHDISSLEEIRK